jgi:alkanesulfonate monooxygenase SsuD/methylene tetrahydromethanopterin reductase-like flavin-dependent oxidoreductase (luciferase family)
MKSALFLPPFGELADARLLAALATEAEAAGFDGFFLWDHVLYREPHRVIADPWVALTAVALATERIRFGPMVTPVPRRRPHVLARQTATLDRLSGGRLIFGAGIGSDGSGEFSTFGDETDVRARGRLLDRGLDALVRYWGGEFEPTPVQRPRPPVWLAVVGPGTGRPVRRARRYDGLFPIRVSPAELAAQVAATGRGPGDFDVAAEGRPGTDPRPYEDAGATWWLVHIDPGEGAAAVRAAIATGPPTL